MLRNQLLAAAFLCAASSVNAAQLDDVQQVRQHFTHPPDDARIMMRWWWFGPAVSRPELTRELEQMKAEGIGGVEIATLYPLALDDPATGFHNQTYLSQEHIELLRFAASEARRLGLRVDITLGSGWPFGGPHIPVTEAAGELRVETVPILPGAKSVAVPDISAGESLITTFLCSAGKDGPSLRDAAQGGKVESGRLLVSPTPDKERAALFFISSRTGMAVKRPAVGAEGFVLDHYDQRAIARHLAAVGDRLMEAFGQQPPYAVFSDSLEVYGSNWTHDLPQEFQRRRGYDLLPHLPALIDDTGPDAAAVRHDWGQTLTELANERFLQPMHAWATQHHTLLRSQTYGFPPMTLSSNAFEDLPEGEGKATMRMWREFSDTRWAASAGHLFGKPVISSEVWTWLHSPAFRATPLDMKAEADLHFLQGINQLVGHGWPYSPPEAGEPGWRMYAAGAFNAHNPWSFAMPDVAGYLQRVSFALRQGKPANDVAFLLPTDDAWATFRANPKARSVTNAGGFDESGSNVSIDESMPRLIGDAVIGNILDAGFNVDFVDADAIEQRGIPYPVLVLPAIDRIPVAAYQKIEDYARHGGIVVATRHAPATVPGMAHDAAEKKSIAAISARLFQGEHPVAYLVQDEKDAGRTIAAHLRPDVSFSGTAGSVGFIHRRLVNADLYFIANTSNAERHTSMHFRQQHRRAETWDPFTGEVRSLKSADPMELHLEPYESRLIVLTDSPAGETAAALPPANEARRVDLTQDWDVDFVGLSLRAHSKTLQSWSEDERTRFYSGPVAYEKDVTLDQADLGAAASVVIDFGKGTAVPVPDPLPPQNMRAYLEGPVRDAAEVYVNGSLAGVVWHPPYTLQIAKWLKPGSNHLRIVVGNTAINGLAGRALPDYRLLNDRFGLRFIPQGMENLQPLPSGMLTGPQLIIGKHANEAGVRP